MRTAAAAHAGAHLVYSPRRFDGTGLAPIARALVGLLEDARVEALAMRELPGLGRLWRPWHTATPEVGSDFESLMARLARALADPSYDDPDAWVRKGRRMFYLDHRLGLLGLRTAAEVRHAALLLGNDIGQMRLQFNARTYRPRPAYRDDHRWMWAAEAAMSEERQTAGTARDATMDDPDARSESVDTADAAQVAFYPEWDRLISRFRPRWARVVEQVVRVPDIDARLPLALPSGNGETARPAVSGSVHLHAGGPLDERPAPRREESQAQGLAPSGYVVRLKPEILRDVRRAIGRIGREDVSRGLDEEGDALVLDALVDWQVARAAGMPGPATVYRACRRVRRRGAALLLVDQSASTADAQGASGRNQLQTAALAADAMAAALDRLGIAFSVAGFESRGRHAVHVRVVKGFDERFDAVVTGRLDALRPQGSTRLGAALRHATRRLLERHASWRWLLVLSDGDLHDIDVHDDRYLPADARCAVREARRRGVQVGCLVLGEGRAAQARRVFGMGHQTVLGEANRTGVALRRLVR